MKRIFLVLPIFLFLHGCATVSLTEEQKQSLSEVILTPTTIANDAYKKPDGTTSPDFGTSVPVAAGGGIFPALIGMAIDSAIKSSQQGKFEGKNAQYFDQIEQQIPKDIYERISQNISSIISSDSFFKDRIRPTATNTLKSEILRYGLVRREETEDDDIKLGMVISVSIVLEDNESNTYFKNFLLGASESAYTMSEYAQTDSLLSDVVNEALIKLEDNLKTTLDTKLGRKDKKVASANIDR